MMSFAIDFDGTLCQDAFPNIGEPKLFMIDLVKRLQRLGHKTILWTCRNGDMLPPAVQWCEKYGLKFDAINENLPEVQAKYGGDTRKVMVDSYIDDKNFGGIDYETLLDMIEGLEEIAFMYERSKRKREE